jgi:hypothetical protein
MWMLTLPYNKTKNRRTESRTTVPGFGGAYLRDLMGEVPTNNIARFETGCLERKKTRRTTRANQMILCERYDVEL